MQLIRPPLISKETIQKRVIELAKEILNDCNYEELHVIIILRGAIFFAVDLLRNLPPVNSIDFIKVSSYTGTQSSGKLVVDILPTDKISQQHILLVEDIFDTGLTTSYIKEWVQQQSPKSIKLCVLLEKEKERNGVNISPDYVGFHIEDKFVVGYGMDYNGRFRNLSDIYVLEVTE